MYIRRGQEPSSRIYTEQQVRRCLTKVGLDIESEVDSDFIVFCPYHNNYRSPAGEVSKTTGMFWCFACQTSKPLEELIMHVSGRSYFESLRIIDSLVTESNIVDIVDKALEHKPDFVPFDEVLIKRLHKQALECQEAMYYFHRRGIETESVHKYTLGYSEKQGMVTIPVTSPDGTYVGFVGRSIEGKSFKNSPQLPKSKTLFNLSNVRRYDEVWVVESSFDAILLEQVGVHAVACLGAPLSKGQVGLLTRYFNSVIIVGDNDDAGKAMVTKALEQMPNARAVQIPSHAKDVGDLALYERHELVESIDDPLAFVLQ